MESVPNDSWHDPPAHDGIERKHAPPVANRGVEILLHGRVVVELSVQVIGEAGVALGVELES